MDIILSTEMCQYALVYLDTIFVLFQKLAQHIQQAATVLRLIRSAGLTMKLNKCFFYPGAINYLGHTVHPITLKTPAKTTDAVRGFRPSTNIWEVRSFLSFCHEYRRFVSNIVKTATLHIAKLKKDKPKSFELDETEFAVMEHLKEWLTTLPILALPRREGKFIIVTDTCRKQVWCVL